MNSRHFYTRLLLAALIVLVSMVSLGRAADTEEQSDLAKRLAASTQVLNEVMAAPGKSIPAGVITRAACIAVFPSTIQVAVLVGAKHGKGFATCRTAKGWSAPAPLDISGGSWGAQLGGEAVDLVLVVTDDKGVQQLESGKFNLGTETSVTAGPVGNQDMKMNSDVISYSRARGAFAGTNITGSSITEDEDNARVLYGSPMSMADILGGKVNPPRTSASFLSTVQKYAGRMKQKD
jgi:lipid-binding SYLF domain-containing protein